jgi:hypothetical protein
LNHFFDQFFEIALFQRLLEEENFEAVFFMLLFPKFDALAEIWLAL